MQRTNCQDDSDWLLHVGEALRFAGYIVVEDVLSVEFMETTRQGLYRVQQATA